LAAVHVRDDVHGRAGVAKALGIGVGPYIAPAMKKALAALLFCLVPSSAGYPQGDVRVTATAIPIDPADPAHRRFGRLRYLAGWQLDSRQRDFGGYSGLSVQGDRFVALADTGKYLSFRMTKPGVIEEPRFADLPAYPAYDGRKGDRDSESMTMGPNGDIWVGFEFRNAILRYAPGFSILHSIGFPPAMKKWAVNSGAEAMVRLEGGRFLIFSEGNAIAPQVHDSLSFPGDPTSARNAPFHFGYRPPRGYAPTDAAQLPDGRIIVLHRRFGVWDGFSAALAIVDPAGIMPGATVAGELIAELKPPLNVDNMEGISVTREDGKTILWLISDDNQVPIERTLLLKFELTDQAG
jgi:hypothetical protein